MSAVPAPSSSLRATWAQPGLGPEALGLASLEELLEPAAAPLERRTVLDETPARTRLAFALPGTPDPRGRLTGKPGPLGTGFVWLSVHHGPLRALLRARWSHPRSASLAEREWNLLCHLRAHGVATPEPLLVAARGAGLVSSHSACLVRAPEEAFPLPRWLRTDGHGTGALAAERGRGLEALGRALARLLASGIALPDLRAEHLWITPSGSGECETHDHGGLRKNKLPGVTLTEVGGARLAPVAPRRLLAPLLADLAQSLTEEERETLVRLALRAEA